MIRAALVAIVSLLVAALLLWFGYGEAKRLVLDAPKRLRAMRQRRRFGRLTPAWQSIIRALDPEAVPSTLGGYHHGYPRGTGPLSPTRK
jgi:hypothetical protein